MPSISLDRRIEETSIHLGMLPSCEVRLVNDARWIWLLLIPQVREVTELHELSESILTQVTFDTASAARSLSEITRCSKINTAAIGNIVRQLHIHVVARNDGDANWPDPVWGHGQRVPIPETELDALAGKIKAVLFVARK